MENHVDKQRQLDDFYITAHYRQNACIVMLKLDNDSYTLWVSYSG